VVPGLAEMLLSTPANSIELDVLPAPLTLSA
jgi:hypothetical protein